MQLAEKYQLIRKLARSFAETELTPEILDEVEDTGIFPAEIQKKMAETVKVLVPEEDVAKRIKELGEQISKDYLVMGWGEWFQCH